MLQIEPGLYQCEVCLEWKVATDEMIEFGEKKINEETEEWTFVGSLSSQLSLSTQQLSLTAGQQRDHLLLGEAADDDGIEYSTSEESDSELSTSGSSSSTSAASSSSSSSSSDSDRPRRNNSLNNNRNNNSSFPLEAEENATCDESAAADSDTQPEAPAANPGLGRSASVQSVWWRQSLSLARRAFFESQPPAVARSSASLRSSVSRLSRASSKAEQAEENAGRMPGWRRPQLRPVMDDEAARRRFSTPRKSRSMLSLQCRAIAGPALLLDKRATEQNESEPRQDKRAIKKDERALDKNKAEKSPIIERLQQRSCSQTELSISESLAGLSIPRWLNRIRLDREKPTPTPKSTTARSSAASEEAEKPAESAASKSSESAALIVPAFVGASARFRSSGRAAQLLAFQQQLQRQEEQRQRQRQQKQQQQQQKQQQQQQTARKYLTERSWTPQAATETQQKRQPPPPSPLTPQPPQPPLLIRLLPEDFVPKSTPPTVEQKSTAEQTKTSATEPTEIFSTSSLESEDNSAEDSSSDNSSDSSSDSSSDKSSDSSSDKSSDSSDEDSVRKSNEYGSSCYEEEHLTVIEVCQQPSPASSASSLPYEEEANSPANSPANSQANSNAKSARVSEEDYEARLFRSRLISRRLLTRGLSVSNCPGLSEALDKFVSEGVRFQPLTVRRIESDGRVLSCRISANAEPEFRWVQSGDRAFTEL